MAFDWVANLFQPQSTRGLSGRTARTVAMDFSKGVYNSVLQRHCADGDIVANPALLWCTSSQKRARTGLGTHLASSRIKSVMPCTDVLVVLSRDDFTRAATGKNPNWEQNVFSTLEEAFQTFCKRENVSVPFKERSLGLQILCDASEEMQGTDLGLISGEFVTGLVANNYKGPIASSEAKLKVRANIPGAWEGYRDLGTLYSDQILFTLGNHWLDNFTHPDLKEAALYCLQCSPSGRLVHVIHPELQDEYEIVSHDQDGHFIMTLATRDGDAIAHVVLDVYDSPGETENYTNPLPAKITQRVFTLRENAMLLQRLHFSEFMEGYDIYVGPHGELGIDIDARAAVIQVRKRGISLLTLIDGIRVAGKVLARDTEHKLEKITPIEVGGQFLEFRPITAPGVSGWPYVGEVRRPATSNYMLWGKNHGIGRATENRVVLPDRQSNDNIQWKPEVSEGATIRTKGGEMPKSAFNVDTIMVASDHATIELGGEVPRVKCNASNCYVYVRRGAEILPLYPKTSPRDPKATDLFSGDELLIGNCLFEVNYVMEEEEEAPTQDAPVEEAQETVQDTYTTQDPEPVEDPVSEPEVESEPPEEAPSPPSKEETPSRPKEVVSVLESTGLDELSHPMQLILTGWMVNGSALCGNHSGADIVVPEYATKEDQSFKVTDYFEIQARGRRGSLKACSMTELLVNEEDPVSEPYDSIDDVILDIIRRDEEGAEDFAVCIEIIEDRSLPDPRARFLALDYEDELAAPLFTTGLPKGQSRTLNVHGATLTLEYDGTQVMVSGYPSDEDIRLRYQEGMDRFQRAPEDGSPFPLKNGDRLVVGDGVYLLAKA